VKILFLCHELPIASYAGTLRVLHSLEPLSGKYGHEITLLAFKLEGKNYPDLSRFCKTQTVEIKNWPGLKAPLAALANILGGRNTAYSSKMAARFCSIMTENNFDLLVIDHPVMLPYTEGLAIPKVLLEAFELAEIAKMNLESETNWVLKPVRWIYYRQMKHYADKYAAVDKIIAVSQKQKEVVLSHRPDLDVEVIPTGIDADYLKPKEAEAEYPNIIITGTMSFPTNQQAVLNFYHHVFPLVKNKVPGVKLFIAGSGPGKELLKLSVDPSVVVTGYLEDLRPVISRAWVAVAPLFEGFGQKIRVLQLLAMGKAVVATSLAAQGLEVTPGKNIIVADAPADMAEKICELLEQPELRKQIGAEARKLAETVYNWDKLTERLNEVFELAVKKNTAARDIKS
jgi:glycosyltransferase involved in cell wall biosynthesis